MLKFFKKFFKTEEVVKEEVNLEKLSEWFNDQAKLIYSDLDIKINEIKDKIKSLIEKTSNDLEILRDATLRNPNIPVRAKQFMEGNRAAYIKRVISFLDRIDIDERNYESLMEFSNLFDEVIKSFTKSTEKPYHVLQEFFANEAKDIAIDIKELEKQVKKLKDVIVDAGIDRAEHVKADIQRLCNKKKRRFDLKERLDSFAIEREKLEAAKKETEEEIHRIKESDDYLDIKGMEVMLKKTEQRLSDHINILNQIFSVLEHSLKKFLRITFKDEDLLRIYVEKPITGLRSDSELKILELLENMRQNIINNKIELKDKKKERTLNEISRLDKEYLAEFLEEYARLNTEVKRIKAKLDGSEVLKKLTTLEADLGELSTKITGLDFKVKGSKDELNKIDIDKLRKELEEKIKNLIKVELVIS